MVACLGGFPARRRDGGPGVRTLGQGLRAKDEPVKGFEAAAALLGKVERSGLGSGMGRVRKPRQDLPVVRKASSARTGDGDPKGVLFVADVSIGPIRRAHLFERLCAAAVVLLMAGTAVGPGAAGSGAGQPPSVLLETATALTAFTPSLASNSSGIVLASWFEQDFEGGSFTSHVYFRMGSTAAGWGAAFTLDGAVAPDLQPPTVALSDSGDGLVIFRAGTYSGGFRPYAVGASVSSWGGVQVIDGGNGEKVSNAPVVAMDANGNGLALWQSDNGTHYSVLSNYFSAGAGWGSPVRLESTPTQNASSPVVGMDAAGNGIAAWSQYDGVRWNIWAARFTPLSGWGAPVLMETDDLASSYGQALAVDPSGDAVLAWAYYGAPNASVFSRRYSAFAGWIPATLLAGGGGEAAYAPAVATYGAGRAAAAYTTDSNGTQEVRARLFDGGWSNASVVAAAPSGRYFGSPRLAAEPSGNLTLVWLDGDEVTYNQNDLWAASLTSSRGWSAPYRVEEATGDVNSAVVVPLTGGRAFAAWSQGYGPAYASHAWVRELSAPDETAPSLTVTEPSEGAKVASPTVNVAGFTEPGAEVTVNGGRAAVGPDGSFSLLIALAAGLNVIQVQAVDPAQNVASQTLSVEFADPLPSLEQEAAARQAELNSTRAELAAVNASLGATAAALAQTQASLAAAQASLSTTQSQLAGAQADLASTRTALNTTQAATTAKDTDLQMKIDAAAGSASTAMLVGLLGLIVGAAAIAMGFMMSKRRPTGALAPPSPPPSMPTAQPPAEPPKTG